MQGGHLSKTWDRALARTLIKENGGLTNTQIAQECGCEETSIRRLRRQIAAERSADSSVTGREVDSIAALADGVYASRSARPRLVCKPRAPTGTLNVITIADAHLSKLCWGEGTGDLDYDLGIASKAILGSVEYLANTRKQDRFLLVFLGDYFHYDTLGGTTTSGTFLDRDSRLPKMLAVGAEVASRSVAILGGVAPTDVLVVPGNHDEVLSAALQRILFAEFKRSPHITIDDTHTRRKYRAHGKTLLGFNHGDKRKDHLAQSMPLEVPRLWGESTYREIHTGHLHSEAERYDGAKTVAGVTVRTHRSMSPPDQWHSDEQYIGSPRGMQSFQYHLQGGLLGMDVADPRLLGL